jgi:hypothetical protein
MRAAPAKKRDSWVCNSSLPESYCGILPLFLANIAAAGQDLQPQQRRDPTTD